MSQPSGPTEAQRITLPTVLDRAAAAAVLPELGRVVGTGPVRIEGEGVERIGQAGLQLLLAVRRSATPFAATIVASPALHAAAELAGVADLLDLSDPEQVA